MRLLSNWLTWPNLSGFAAIRSRLFRKYVAIFVFALCFALIAHGLFGAWFFYRDHKALIARNQREQAAAAAEKIEAFIQHLANELGWISQLPWSSGTASQQYLDALRLLRQVPAITEFAQVDADGHEQLRVSRLVMDVMGSGLDRAREPSFAGAIANRAYYGDVYFRRGSEPYMTVALAGKLQGSGVMIAEVNLTFIWDVVSKIRVGERGYAYVVASDGRLIAHPEIDLVLRYTNFSQLEQVEAARAGGLRFQANHVGSKKNIHGDEVLSAFAPVTSLGWTVFAELPIEEAYAPLYASLWRSAVLLFAGLGLAVLAGLYLARRMVVPIEALCDGAVRIGGGDFGQRLTIETGDELEILGEQFNRMASQLQDFYADLERQVKERTHELEVANLAKSRFIATASHDLRQPLQALGFFVAQLRHQAGESPHAQLVNLMDAAVAEMNNLFDALLDMSKLDAGAVTPSLTEFPVTTLLQRLDSTFSGPAGNKGLKFSVSLSGAWVRSDIVLLERILLNLVSNAVRYTEHGGIAVGCRVRGSLLRIEVWDSGPGIPEDHRQNIFEEFYQIAKGAGQSAAGMGLGLAIVDRLCRLLGHRIELSSVAGRGSRFTIILPHVPAVHGPERAALPAGSPSGFIAGKSAVVIDDAKLVVEAVDGLLRSWGCKAVAANSAQQALEQLREQGQAPDLIICDYHLQGGQTGIAAIDLVRTAFDRQIPAFLISGDTAPERLREANASGYYLLYKPVSAIKLRAVLTQVLRDGDSLGCKK
jgi:signal transduction histidine kinase/CheY-like chemotaxis protein